MDLRRLRYFVAVAEELHFRRAAERVHIAQPALSVQIKALEEELGGCLIVRSNRRVELTEAGRLLLEQSRQILAQVDAAAGLTRRALRGEAGVLRLTYSGNAAESGMLARCLRAFRRRHADVEIQAMEMDPASQQEALLSGRVHAALTTTLARTLPPQLMVQRLGAWPLRLALPDDHPLAQRRQIRIADVVHQPFVVYATHGDDDGTSVLRQVAGFDPVVAHRVGTAVMVTALVGAGLGLGLLPASMETVAAHAGAVLRPLASVKADMDVSLVVLSGVREPVATRLLEVAMGEFEPC
ncbi:LysR substrate-binding domain-containing protein [Halotalea alkalilenta]|uniref:LysR substrate-binding domain-containing protein n=1 Tax=Halotalea alkalilenta TaxID=376489 RepID=UPI000693D595|nr:LysR substrate-binding domain-containing protein [Halotalea alkalilenta]